MYLNLELRFIVYKGANTYYKNLLITNKVIGLILNNS